MKIDKAIKHAAKKVEKKVEHGAEKLSEHGHHHKKHVKEHASQASHFVQDTGHNISNFAKNSHVHVDSEVHHGHHHHGHSDHAHDGHHHHTGASIGASITTPHGSTFIGTTVGADNHGISGHTHHTHTSTGHHHHGTVPTTGPSGSFAEPGVTNVGISGRPHTAPANVVINNPSTGLSGGVPTSRPTMRPTAPVSTPVVAPSTAPSGPTISGVGNTTPVAGAGTNVGASTSAGATTGPLGTGMRGPHGVNILSFQAKKPTWGCHWFPMKEHREGGDPTNNLFAKGGCLDKLDQLTGGNARDWEFQNARKDFHAGAEFNWWGHCNNAAEISCVLPAVKHGVTMNGANGQEVEFTPNDIQGLLVSISSCLVDRVDFRGERYNGRSDNPNDPSPEMFLSTVQEWAKAGMPFAMDIDPKQQVWNFAYDGVQVFENVSGNRREYYIEVTSTGYPEHNRTYQAFIEYDANGRTTGSGWLNTPDTDNNPDFLWRPIPKGDLMNSAMWTTQGNQGNPHISPQTVYDIYIQSIG